MLELLSSCHIVFNRFFHLHLFRLRIWFRNIYSIHISIYMYKLHFYDVFPLLVQWVSAMSRTYNFGHHQPANRDKMTWPLNKLSVLWDAMLCHWNWLQTGYFFFLSGFVEVDGNHTINTQINTQGITLLIFFYLIFNFVLYA